MNFSLTGFLWPFFLLPPPYQPSTSRSSASIIFVSKNSFGDIPNPLHSLKMVITLMFSALS